MEDKRKKLYQIFLDNKLITEKTSLERWMRMSEREAEKIFNLGKENKLFGQETEAVAFTSLWAEDPVKKKESSDLSSDVQEDIVQQDSSIIPTNTQSDSTEINNLDSQVQEEVNTDINSVEVDSIASTPITTEVEETQLPSQTNILPEFSEVPRYNQFGSEQNLAVGEKNTAVERVFGKNFATDFLGDLYRSGAAGRAQGATLDESLELFFKGNNVTDQDIQEFIEAQQSLQNIGESDEMKEFNRIYEEAGGGVWGFIKGNVLTRFQTLPQLLVSSTTQMFNSSTLGSAAVGGAVGSAIPILGTIGGAIGAATTTLETATTFAELLQNELRDRELDFTNENVRTILEDEDALSSIRWKSGGRGVAVGVTELLTARVAGAVGAKILNRGPKSLKTNLKALGSVAAIEAVGGSTGEVAGNIIAGQELDAANVLFEGAVGLTGTPFSAIKAIYQRPKYYLNLSNGGKELAATTEEDMIDIIENSPDEDYAQMELTIENNPELNAKMTKRKTDLHERAVIEGSIRKAGVENQSAIDDIIPLQVQINALAGVEGEAARIKRGEIKEKIAEIILNQNDAVQESSTDTDVVQESSTDADVVQETTTETEVESTPVEKTEVEAEVENVDVQESNEESVVMNDSKPQEMVELTEETFNEFVDTGEVSDPVLRSIANKIKNDTKLTKQEEAVRQANTKKVEALLKDETLNEESISIGKEDKIERVQVPGSRTVDVEIDSEGKFTPVNRKTGRPIKDISKLPVKVQEFLLKEVIDVNEGKTAIEIFKENNPDSTPTEKEFNDLRSENAREIAEAIIVEQEAANNRAGLAKEMSLDSEEGGTNLYGEKVTEREWYRATGQKGKDIDAATRKNWITGLTMKQEEAKLKRSKEGKIGPYQIPKSGLAQKAVFASENAGGGVDPQMLERDFYTYAQNNPNGVPNKTNRKQATSDRLNDLKFQFQEVTGLKPSKQNVDAVMSIDPDRPPLQAIKQDIKNQQKAQSTNEPATNNKGKKVNADKIVGGKKKRKTVVVDEMDALINQIKREEKAAQRGQSVYKKISKEVSKKLADLKQKGKLTKNQALVLSRAALRVDVTNPEAVEKYLKFITKIFSNADLANRIVQSNKKRKIAKKNISKGKLGAINGTLSSILDELLNVNSRLIPAAQLNTYLDLVDMLSSPGTTISLDEISKVQKDTEAILKALDQEYSLAKQLAIMYKYYRDTNPLISESSTFSEVLTAMKKDKAIDDSEMALMKKYKKEIDPDVRETKSEEELAQEKSDLIRAIVSTNKLKSKTDQSFTSDQKSLIDNFTELINKDILDRLTSVELRNVLQLQDNINNGYAPHYLQLITEKMNAIKLSKKLSASVKRSKPLKFSMLYAKAKDIFTKKGAMREFIRRNPLYYIDQLFNDFQTQDIFNSIFDPTARKQAVYQQEVKELNRNLDDAKNKLYESLGNDGNATTESSYKISTYMLKKEQESNPNSKEVSNVREVMGVTIDAIDGKLTSLSSKESAILKKIVDKYSNEKKTDIDIDKLYNSFSKEERAVVNLVNKINKKNESKAVFTATTIRGKKITPLANYVHHDVMFIKKPDEDATSKDFVKDYSAGLRPSTKGQNLIERTPGVKPLNFDIFSSAKKGAKYVYLDYYLTTPIRTARKTINEARKRLNEGKTRLSDQKLDTINAIEAAFEEATANLLTSDFGETSFGDMVIDFVSKQGYRTVLAGTGRFGAELLSNVGAAMFIDSSAFSKGLDFKELLMSDQGAIIMGVVGAKQTDRVFNEGLSGRFVDPSLVNRSSNDSGSRVQNDVKNKINILTKGLGGKYAGSVAALADFLIATPDKIVMRPMWFGSFANEFKKVSGQEVNFDKIAAKDTKYLADNKKAIEAATSKADMVTVQIGATDNPYMGILKGTSKPNQSVTVKAFNNYNNFMTRFLIFEFVTARTAVHAMMNEGDLMTSEQGAKVLAGVTTRMVSYSLLSTLLGSGLIGLLFNNDDEDEKDIEKKVGQALGSTFTSLLLGRDFGNAVKGIINIGVEKFNESHLEFLRDGEYDPYKDSLQFSVLPKKQQGKSTSLGDILLKLGGSFGPAFSTADLVVRKLTEPKRIEKVSLERQKKEINLRVPLEILGNLGLVPLYKDVRKEANKYIYEDLRKAKAQEKRNPKRSREELKKLKISNPNAYKNYIDKQKTKGNSSKQKAYDKYNRNRTLWMRRNPGKKPPKRP